MLSDGIALPVHLVVCRRRTRYVHVRARSGGASGSQSHEGPCGRTTAPRLPPSRGCPRKRRHEIQLLLPCFFALRDRNSEAQHSLLSLPCLSRPNSSRISKANASNFSAEAAPRHKIRDASTACHSRFPLHLNFTFL